VSIDSRWYPSSLAPKPQPRTLSRAGWAALALIVLLCVVAGQPFYQLDLAVVIEMATNGLLAAAVVTGLLTLHYNVHRFQEFRCSDVMDGRVDALIYILVSFSTAMCLFALVVRVTWSMTDNWAAIPNTWKIVLLSVPIGLGAISTGMHLLVHKVLRSDLWDQCKRM